MEQKYSSFEDHEIRCGGRVGYMRECNGMSKRVSPRRYGVRLFGAYVAFFTVAAKSEGLAPLTSQAA
jgi:hypothetical protein